MPQRPYIFYELTNSICGTCLKRAEAKIIFQDDKVYMHKRCLEHGLEKVLISTDIGYYKKCREFNKPGDMPLKFNTPIRDGCPYDCGLCPDHEQHSCLTLIEITDRCNLSCPTCYAVSGPNCGRHRSLDEIAMMLDKVVENEGEPDVIQISGGEPTIHPDFFQILAMAKERPIKHLMVNTNGIEIAKDPSFAQKLAEYMPGFEVYLQFDSFDNDVIHKIRGAKLLELKLQAIENLNQANVSTTLVTTLQRGQNTQEIGKLLDFARNERCIRGIVFQPTQAAGRIDDYDPKEERITLGEVRQEILKQSELFTKDDLVPVPCHPDALMMGYALKIKGEFIPLTRYITPEELLSSSRNTITFEKLPDARKKVFELFSTSASPRSATESLKSLLCCLPYINAPELSYENIFRVIVMQFYDKDNFDIRGVKKSCVHIVHQDGRIIPFDTMNIFYRDNQIETLGLKKASPSRKGD